jgi:membrane associated rhomboid family serine protease
MFQSIPNVVKNLLIVNVLMFLADNALGPWFGHTMSAYYMGSDFFRPWQIVTHMFMHGSFTHLFFNMYALFLFGSSLERYMGPKRFLTYYLLTGLGAFFLHQGVAYIEIEQLKGQMSALQVQEVYENGASIWLEGKNYTESLMRKLNISLNVGLVGASGAVFGVLLAFGMLFPNTELMLLFPPIPIKAKWFVMIYGAIELMLALRNAPDDNVAHYAHLGGMIFGYILLKYWQRQDGHR